MNGTFQGLIIKNGRDWLQFGGAGKNKTPRVLVSFRLVGGEYDGSVVQWDGWLTTNKAVQRTTASLRTLGFTGTDLKAMMNQAPKPEPVELVVEEEEYEGKTRTRVAFINSGGGFSVRDEDRLSSGDLDELSERIAQLNGAGDSFDAPAKSSGSSSFPDSWK